MPAMAPSVERTGDAVRPTRGRVLIVEQGEGLWGAQRYLLRLAPLLEQHGYEQILAAPEESAMAQAWRSSGRPHVAMPVPDDRAIRRDGDRGPIVASLVARELQRTAANSRLVARLAREVGAGVVHANSHWSHLECALAGRLSGLPTVLHLHEETLPGVAGRLRAISVRVADASVAVSYAVARCLPERTRRRVTVIQNGIDTSLFTPGPADPEIRREMAVDPSAPVVLVMCRLDPAKGVDHVIRAVAAFPENLRRVQLAIAGSGSLQPAYAAHLRELGAELLGDRVRFLGPRSDVAKLLRAADVLALGSSLEGLPLGILEAHACGTPVAAYPAAGVPEVVHHGETGLLAPQGDIADLSRCLARLLLDPPLRERIAAAARAQVQTSFSLQGQADRQAELLEGLLSQPAEGAGS